MPRAGGSGRVRAVICRDTARPRKSGARCDNPRVTADLVAKARTGDGEAFRQLVEPHRRELRLHCYRILGSMQDAEEALQDTLLVAWQHLSTFEERSSLRTWLYRIATRRSLNTARSRSRHRRGEMTMPTPDLPPPNGRREVTWLEPCSDTLLEGIADHAPGPDARYEVSESVSLAFVAALQVLPPRGRVVLILRDVLGYHTGEVARILETTEESVASALKRARAALQRERSSEHWAAPPEPRSTEERELADRFARAFQATDVNGLVALLKEPVRFAMPPLPFEWRGRESTARFLEAVWGSLSGAPRLVPTRANAQPAFAFYAPEPDTRNHVLLGILVLTLIPGGIIAITRFEPASLHHFTLPATL